MKKFIYIFVLLGSVLTVHAQDPQFSQFYEVPTYLNPAFAGGSHHYRGIFHQRMQWPSLDARYITTFFSADKYFNEAKSGVGLTVMQDIQERSGHIKSTNVSLQYAYELHVNRWLTVRPGVQLGYLTRNVNWNNLTIPQQYDDNGMNGQAGLYSGNMRTHMADVSSGIVGYTNNTFFGVSAHHLNRPNESFVGGVSRLPVKYTLMAGHKIPLVHTKHMAYLESEKDISITPTVHYKFQGKSDQLDIGSYFNYDQFFCALWYRGIPFKRYERLQNNESMVAHVGYRYEGLSVGYSYDFVVSKLTGANPRGAHEINITYIILKKHKNNKPMRVLPCPNFYKKTTDKHHLENHHHDGHYKHNNALPGQKPTHHQHPGQHAPGAQKKGAHGTHGTHGTHGHGNHHNVPKKKKHF
ncbi:MAG: type IX secretion system membrane protein PorP/SprF [Cytophagaceae bacterium]